MAGAYVTAKQQQGTATPRDWCDSTVTEAVNHKTFDEGDSYRDPKDQKDKRKPEMVTVLDESGKPKEIPLVEAGIHFSNLRYQLEPNQHQAAKITATVVGDAQNLGMHWKTPKFSCVFVVFLNLLFFVFYSDMEAGGLRGVWVSSSPRYLLP
jgi:hypothetical protein